MNRPAAHRLRHIVPAALLIALVGAAAVPAPSVATPVQPAAAPVDAVPVGATASGTGGSAADDAATVRLTAPSAAGTGAATDANGAGPGQQPSEAYQEWLAHANDRIAFTPGGRVTVGFTPRSTDRWSVGGQTPVALPAGLATGRAMAAAAQGSAWAEAVPPSSGAASAGPSGPSAADGSADQGTSGQPGTATPAVATTSTTGSPQGAAVMTAGLAPLSAGPALATPASLTTTATGTATTTAASALRRQVFGFLPYWEVSGSATTLNYGVLTTIAYFSVGANSAGNLLKRNSDGSVTTGWAGWTSSSLTSVINAAHAQGTRVVLTVSVFAWTSGEATVQKTLLGSSTARLTLAQQIAAAVRDRGADGVNLDFEPLVTGQEANFVAFLKTLRSQLNAIKSGYQITYDTTGYIGNYPLEASVGSAAADAVFIMGYDYRTASSSTSGSIDPLSGPTYDLTDTVREYTARISPSRVILGVPWYGRAWSTTTSAPRSTNQSGAKYGYSTAVNYQNIPALVSQYGRKWDSVEQSPYIVYQRQNCTTTYGCVTSWRQVWYDDATSLAGRYQLVNDYGLRGAGMWALGYDGAYQDMVHALSDAFLVDHTAPQAGIKALPPKSPDEGITVSWLATDVSAVRSYDVQVAVDAGNWAPWITGTTRTSAVWLGADGHGYAFRVRATDSHGNVGTWNVTTASAATPASLAVGGFGRVTLAGLAYRTGPSTTAAKLGSLAAGTIVALTSGPVVSGGYTWYEATQPIREWSPASFVERGVWIAAGSSTATYIVPFHAPNTTIVDAGITGFDFGDGGLTGSTPGAVAGRAFSPNGDGSMDTLRVRWTAMVALGSLTLNVLRTDGSLVGAVAVPTLTTGTHTFAWNGAVAGTRVPDGTYLLQLVGVAGATTYHAPSATPATPEQIAAFAVTVDTVPPTITSSSASTAVISPNADGIRDTVSFALAATGASSWSVRIAPTGGAPIRTITGTGATLAATWDGRNSGGAVVPDGAYTATLAAIDTAGNSSSRTYPVRVDVTPSTVVATAVPALFSPNGDSWADRTSLRWTSSESTSGTAALWRGTTLIRRWTVAASTGGAITWDGRTASGTAVADGRYTFRVDVRDAAGNRTIAATTVTVDRTVGFLRWSRNFFPQDGDSLLPTSVVSWRMTRTGTTTLAIYDLSGNLVRAVWTNRPLGPGTPSWTWNGRASNGTYVPQGIYVARLTVVSPYGRQVLTRTVRASAFAATLPTTLRVGQTLTASFSTIEPLRTTPVVTFRQPGSVAPVVVTATRLANGTFRASFTVRAGPAGNASIRIAATDTGGRLNAQAYGVTIAP